MDKKNHAVRMVECPACGKTLSVVCPDAGKEPSGVSAVKEQNDTDFARAQRKSFERCRYCYGSIVIYWNYSRF